jgi:tetratricopeptide (TPR) repeat protein
MKYLMRLFLLIAICSTILSCKKYLDIKPDTALSTLSTVAEVQLFLDNYQALNIKFTKVVEAGADTYNLSDVNWNSATVYDRAAYVWQKTEAIGDWQDSYNVIFFANTALDELNKINGAKEQAGYDGVKGSALFFRAFYYYGLSQVYTPVYDPNTASSDLGLPLRTDPDYRIPSVRVTVKQTYDLILKDLKEAASLLPVTPIAKTRPSKPAAFAMIARTYLTMRQYDSAGVYADKCLKIYNDLLNVNNLDVNASAPFTRLNKEIIFYAISRNLAPLNSSRAFIEPELYNSYGINDLRKTAYFRANTGVNAGTYAFKGDYDRSSGNYGGYLFVGPVTDEVYLTRAECYARAGNTDLALNDLNTLLITRWKTGTFVPFTASTANEALIKILAERKKELLFRGLRWMDMRRLSKEPQFAKTYKRTIAGQEYELTPESLRYTYLIPEVDVIQKTGIPQNQ